ncbi:MAG: MATE family efflux transporter [Victivallales bacterium]|nr:MATE family efflux transporter [Victivallales bacterium]
MKTKIINDFTEGPLFWKLLTFSLPFMLSNALQMFYNLVDMIIVGQYLGSPGLASVSISSQCHLFMTMVCTGFCTGGQIYISQLIGKGERQKLNQTIGTIFTVVFCFGLIMTAAGLIFAVPLLKVMHTPAESWNGALHYMLVCSSGIIFSYGYNMLSAVLRGMGDSRHPFIFILIASLINLFLDWLFVAVFHWGVFGAGLATILGQAFSFLYGMWFLYQNKEAFCFDFKPASFRIHKEVFRSLLRLGVPMALRFGAINISMMFVMSMVSTAGHQATAVFGVGGKLDDMSNKICQGVMQALAAVVGQNYGARKFNRVKWAVVYTWLITIGIYAVYTICLVCYTRQMFGVFTKDEEVLSLAPVFVSAILWHFPALLIMKGTNGFINGIGNAWLSLCFSVLDGFILRIFCTWLFGNVMDMGLYGYFLGYAIAGYGMAIPSLLYFLFFPWEKRKLVVE